MPSQITIPITDSSQIGEARRHASRISGTAHFNEGDRAKAAIITSELATNLARHAVGGEILIQSLTIGDREWIEILSVDRGPGISNVGKCLEDGYSTGGTSGTGLGAARRMATEFDIYSMRPGGTIVLCRLAESAVAMDAAKKFSWGAINQPAPYETACGDAWSIRQEPNTFSIAVVDGLGHGPEAAAAADDAIEVFGRNPFGPLTMYVESAHVKMHGTRGAALAVAQIDVQARILTYVGVGNIAGHLRDITSSTGRGLCSHNGIVGVQIRKVQEFTYECPHRGLLIMHSDGLQSRWALDGYPGIAHCHPAIVAAVLYRDFKRGRDDVTVVVVQLNLV